VLPKYPPSQEAGTEWKDKISRPSGRLIEWAGYKNGHGINTVAI
jgi:hypothetical protein